VLLEDDRVEKRTIRRGRRLDDRVIVEAGLRAGERVIVEGIHKVRHGETAEAVPPTTAEVPDPQAESAVASAEVTVE
jgi:membrane fusion protein (multidrug efflux system)